jgi:UDP-N-acetylglucosamine 2-epimerase (non-hydrolysing)
MPAGKLQKLQRLAVGQGGLPGGNTASRGFAVTRLRIVSVVGARPNFIKVAPLCREFDLASREIEHILVHTGQHYDIDMDRDFFHSLRIPKPDINLGVGAGSPVLQTAEIMKKFEPYCLDRKPDWIVVFGDVNSTLACAIVARKLGIRLAHVEAGLRSFDMTMPEEINRKVTDCISDLLFTPSQDADDNLFREGVPPERVIRVGNIMIDTLVMEMDTADRQRSYQRWGLAPKQFVYVTLHRPSNVDDPEVLSSILEKLSVFSGIMPVIFPLHPRTARRLREFNLTDKIGAKPHFHATSPLSYHESINLAKNAKLVVTDSGGLQEETTFLGTPCLTLRPNTERPITITQGTNRLITEESMIEAMKMQVNEESQSLPPSSPPLWDGRTAKRIVAFFLAIIEASAPHREARSHPSLERVDVP